MFLVVAVALDDRIPADARVTWLVRVRSREGALAADWTGDPARARRFDRAEEAMAAAGGWAGPGLMVGLVEATEARNLKQLLAPLR